MVRKRGYGPLPLTEMREASFDLEFVDTVVAARYTSPNFAYAGVQADTLSFGLKWRNVGEVEPSDGEKLINFKLSEALKNTPYFEQEEWQDFDIKDLRAEHYIESGATFFKPFSPYPWSTWPINISFIGEVCT